MACFPGQKAGAPPSAPTTPSNLTATPQPSGTQILLQWNPSIDGDITVSYVVRRCSGVGCTNFTVITNTVANAVNYVDSGLQVATSYSYTVQAVDGSGNFSGLSNIATTSTRILPQNTAQQQSPALAALKWPQDLWSVQSETNVGSLLAAVLKPSVPANFTATPISSSQINLSWTASTEPNVPISLYTIVISPGSTTVQVSAPATSYNDTGLTTSTTYSYTISATDIHGNTSGTSSASATTAASTGLNFPKIAIVASGGDQSDGQTGYSGFTTYSAAGPGTTVYTAVQNLGSYDLVWGLNGSYEGWSTGGTVTRNKQDLVQAIKAKGTYGNTKNTARTPIVLPYSIMESMQNLTSGSGYQGFCTQIINNNWWTYETAGGTGTMVPSAASGSGYFEVNYSYAWDTAAGPAALDTPICSNVYGSASSGMGPAQTAAQYWVTALLTTNRTADSRFTTLNTNGAAPNADGIVLDNTFAFPNAGGTLAVTSASWDGIGTQSNSAVAAYPSGASSLLARGQYHFFKQYQSFLATVNPGSTYLNMGNFGSYTNTIGSGNIHSATAGAMDSVLHGGLIEGVAGFAGASYQTFQTAADILINYAYGLAYCQSPQAVCIGVVLPATDGSETATFVTGGTAQTVSTGTALEYQMMRCMLCLTLMNNGYFAAGVNGYNALVTRYYDEYGDDSLTQVNVKRGYLGQPTAAYVTLSSGLLLRQFQNGVALCNPWGNGSVIFTVAQLTTATGISGYMLLKGTQQTAINTGNSFSAYTFADGDGLILVVSSALTITNVNPLTPQGTVGSAYGKTMSATGGTPPYIWSLVSATPNTGNWVSVTSAGVVQGTPTTAETETITIKVADSASNSTQTAYTLVVNAAAAGNFISASGFSISSPSGVSNGSPIIINSTSSIFGNKPYAPNPLLWAPMDTSGNPSSLGRITSFQTASGLANGLSYSATGGPNGSGCFSGSGSPSPGTTGYVYNATQAIDMAQWGGWAAADPYGGGNGYYLNDYGQKIYLYRRVWKNFGHLDQTSTLSYNGIGSYNVKNFRCWTVSPVGTVGGSNSSASSDVYMPPSDQIFAFDSITISGAGQDYPSGGGSQNYEQETVNAVVSADGISSQWYGEEMILTSNSNSTNLDANFNWRVPAAGVKGPFINGSMYNFPVTTYHLIAWQFLNSSNAQTIAGNLRGTISRIYPMHFIVDGTSGRPALPSGSYIQYAWVYLDDSYCRVMATNSSTWGSETDSVPQPPTAWAAGRITVSAFNVPLNYYIWVVDSTNTPHYVGQRTS